MGFDLKSFAAQVRPSPRKPSPKAFDNSVFDAGSPQYVRPEDLFLDIQSWLFVELERLSSRDLSGVDPGDFRTRWLKDGAAYLSIQQVRQIEDEQLGDAIMSLLRCPRRKAEHHPTLLPIVPALGFYKNIKPNLPNFLNDQLRPALSFADETGFSLRISTLQDTLWNGKQADDSLKQLATALLPRRPRRSHGAIQAAAREVKLHEGPLLKNYSVTPSQPLSVCRSLKDAVDVLIEMEAVLPRILWTRWLTAALRLWLPLFFLKRCAVTTGAAQAVRTALASGSAPSPGDLTSNLLGTSGVLRGSNEWLNQLAPVIQDYVRSRFELSILLELSNLYEWLTGQRLDPAHPDHIEQVKEKLADYEVDPASPSNPPLPRPTGILMSVSPVRLSMPGDTGAGNLPFDEWLKWIVSKRQSLDMLAKTIGAENTVDLVEKVYAYVRPEYEPLRGGFGKNAYEYVAYELGAPQKADRDPDFPDEFNLIYRSERGRRTRQIMVQPGPHLLIFLVQLVSQQAGTNYRTSAKFSDLLDLFDTLGVDFRSQPADFENLKVELVRLGLLQSSADAAEAASLNPAFTF